MAKRDLSNCFEQELATGVIVEDGKIPPFRALAERYECSPATIKRLVDQFELKGILRTIRGSGTFLTSADAQPPRRIKRQHIGAIVLDDQIQKELDRLKEEYLALGWFFSIYNASADQQSPEREKNFLKLALEQDFEAVILEATPIAPLNTALFRQLRHEGVKVVHLSPYCAEMNLESSFLPDFYAAGQLGIVQLALKQYQRVCLFDHDVAAPFLDIGHAGTAAMAAQLQIEIVAAPPHETAAQVVARALRDDRKTAIFCANADLGDKVCDAAAAAGVAVPGRLGILSLCAICDYSARHSQFEFPYAELVDEALRFATDKRRDPFEPLQRRFQPVFIDRNTI